MEALVVILIIILAALVVTSVVLIVMAVGLTRNISRTQRNIKDIGGRVDDMTTLAGVASSIYGLAMKAVPKKPVRKTQKRKK